MSVFSTKEQLEKLASIIFLYARLPIAEESIPGAFLESALAYVRGAKVLRNYDFVDVVHAESKMGWQVKSTKSSTPVTWKRAKIPNQEKLIQESRINAAGLQALGNAVLDFCNKHVAHSFKTYGLNEIGFARLIVRDNGTLTYFERKLCDSKTPILFEPAQFTWKWSEPKRTIGKEQLQALHGTYIPTGKKWFAWHGLGENQLHFSGEGNWWPNADDVNAITFARPKPEQKIGFEKLVELMATLKDISAAEVLPLTAAPTEAELRFPVDPTSA